MTRTPRSGWIDEGLRALSVGGPDTVRIEQLAKALGVTKGGFYWHFNDRQALLEEMLSTWERRVIDEPIQIVKARGGDEGRKLRRLFALAAFDDDLLAIEISIREWARRDPAVAERLRRVDNRRMAYMRELFSAFCPDPDDVEVRCTLVMALFISNHFVAVDHPAHTSAEVLNLALARLLDPTPL